MDWDKVGKEFQGLFEGPGDLDSADVLDTVVKRLTRTMGNVVERNSPNLSLPYTPSGGSLSTLKPNIIM